MGTVKNLIKIPVFAILKFAAFIQLNKMQCKVIGITGSIGKTSCKDFLYELLKTKYIVRKTPKSLNSESGVPLAILGQESGYSSFTKWSKVFIGVIFTLLFDWRKVDFFVIEMGVDKPGDMSYLLSFIKPYAAIFLSVAPVHTANFSMFTDPLKAIYDEKHKLPLALPQDGILVEASSTELKEIKSCENGLEFTLISDRVVNLRFLNVLGSGFAKTLGAAAVMATKFNIDNAAIQQVAAGFRLPPGRMSLLPGIKNTVIIDSSYNASKYPMLMSLDVLGEFKDRRKIAVFGDMRELGSLAQIEHEEVAKKAVKVVDEIVLVGPLMGDYFMPEALKLGFSKDLLHWFGDSDVAAQFLVNNVVKGGEAILVKGSQNTIYLEKVVYALMLEKEKSGELLCRQDTAWKMIKR